MPYPGVSIRKHLQRNAELGCNILKDRLSVPTRGRNQLFDNGVDLFVDRLIERPFVRKQILRRDFLWYAIKAITLLIHAPNEQFTFNQNKW